MKRNNLFIILSIIAALSFFMTAAVCNFCGARPGPEPDTAKKDVEETAGLTKPEGTDKDNGQNIQKEAPAISLSISEGPLYSETDDVCYYRIKATVTGKPAPGIVWSADYSNGAFGNTIAQINLTRSNPNYNLTATATNSEGSATDNIELSWACDAVEEENNVLEETIILSSIGSLSEDGWEDFGRFTAFIGDDERNRQIKGVLGFSSRERLERLFGSEVLEVRAIIPRIERVGAPEFGDIAYVRPCHYIEFSPRCSMGEAFAIAGLESINFAGESFKQTMQHVLDNNIPQFHLILEFGGGITNSNGRPDGLKIEGSDNIRIILRYR